MKIAAAVAVPLVLALATGAVVVVQRGTGSPAAESSGTPAVLVDAGDPRPATRVASPNAASASGGLIVVTGVPIEHPGSADTGAFDIPREVPPTQLVSCEEFWELQGPIFAALPHMRRDDAQKLRYFCPADFDKNDSVDPDDVALFVAAWRDASHPLSAWTDINADGTIDLDDLDAFLLNYQQGGCDPVEARNYRDVIC